MTDTPEDGARALSATAGCGPLIAPERLLARPLRLQVFERVRAAGTMSRVQVSRELDISPASVTTLTSELIQRGLLREVGLPRDLGEGMRGRPPVALGVCPGTHYVAGIKVSDQAHTAVLLDLSGNRIATAALEVEARAFALEDLLDTITRLLAALVEQAGMEISDLSAVGLGVPGFVEHSTGELYWSPFVAEKRIDLAGHASAHLGLPVVVDNDANLVALAELWFGAGRDISDFAVVTIEHGVGMGLVVNHRLYRGARGLGMELGHTKVQLDGALCRCGQRGCLEAYVADYALAREADTALNALGRSGRPIREQLESLFEQAKAGNGRARSVFHRAARYLTLGLANVVNLFDPGLIILSGERMRYDYLYDDNALSELDGMILDTGRASARIQVEARGDLLWAMGAGALALAHVTEMLFAPTPEVVPA